ncbi:MAG: tetratricopeptide repeat protein [Actinophytocola sp.]|uniref:tetratricopeptide repeat protein n=1 Tax=Actinophytocola sp. TaxID=1872138 RepID=UPI00132CBC43|nr:tetratricopeptide repeat protein [Actinophytocola sp.]MPZ79638.1 tetratricopeptide repeat protein [Actinophytocola sp.]
MAEQIGSIDTVLVRAAHLTAEGRPESAIAMLRPALELFPEHSAAWCRLAAAQLDAGEPGESLAAAKRAMALGERSWAHRLASLALVELGRYGEAVVSAREAVRRDAADWRCHVTLAEALTHDAPAAAVKAARAAVALAPDQPRVHEVLGDATVATHDWPAAESAYRAALRLDPANDDIVAKIDRLVRRHPEHPERRGRPVRTRAAPRFGRIERVCLFLAVRRASVWQAVGTVVLLVAGLPSPSGLLVWFGLGVVVFVGTLSWRGWLGLPPAARVPLPELSKREPLIAGSAVLLGVSVLLLIVWNVLLALGSAPGLVLVGSVGCAAVAVANSWYGLWRVWAGSR